MNKRLLLLLEYFLECAENKCPPRILAKDKKTLLKKIKELQQWLEK